MTNNVTLMTESVNTSNLNYRIKEICKEKGLMEKDLGKAVGKTQVTFSRILNGVTPLTTSLLEKIAKHLDVSPHELLEVEDGYEHFYGTKTKEWLGIRKID